MSEAVSQQSKTTYVSLPVTDVNLNGNNYQPIDWPCKRCKVAYSHRWLYMCDRVPFYYSQSAACLISVSDRTKQNTVTYRQPANKPLEAMLPTDFNSITFYLFA